MGQKGGTRRALVNEGIFKFTARAPYFLASAMPYLFTASLYCISSSFLTIYAKWPTWT
jgi:hypothetical protein